MRGRERTDKKKQKSPQGRREGSRENKRREKGERENENVGSTVFCSRAHFSDAENVFFASRPISPEDKGTPCLAH